MFALFYSLEASCYTLKAGVLFVLFTTINPRPALCLVHSRCSIKCLESSNNGICCWTKGTKYLSKAGREVAWRHVTKLRVARFSWRPREVVLHFADIRTTYCSQTARPHWGLPLSLVPDPVREQGHCWRGTQSFSLPSCKGLLKWTDIVAGNLGTFNSATLLLLLFLIVLL